MAVNGPWPRVCELYTYSLQFVSHEVWVFVRSCLPVDRGLEVFQQRLRGVDPHRLHEARAAIAHPGVARRRRDCLITCVPSYGALHTLNARELLGGGPEAARAKRRRLQGVEARRSTKCLRGRCVQGV